MDQVVAARLRAMVVIVFVVAMGMPVRALAQEGAVADFLRTHFTTDEGLSGSVVDQIGQTPDGFLWLAFNGSYLSRFDGKRFYRFDKRATALATAPDGALWIGNSENLIRVPPAALTQFTFAELPALPASKGRLNHIICMHFSRTGVLWIGTADGAFRYEHDEFVAAGPRALTRQIEEAPDGHVLVTSVAGFTEFAGPEIVPHPGLADRVGVRDADFFDVLRDRRGTTWYCTASGVARETGGHLEKLGSYGGLHHAAYRVHEDAQGAVWIAKDEGVFRSTPDGLELIAANMQARAFFSDRDGNVWVGTNGDGLYRFKARAVRMFTTADGLAADVIMTVLATRDGALWAGGNCGGISRIQGTHVQTFDERSGLQNGCVYALAEDASGDVWVGTWGGGAFRYHRGAFTQYAKAQGMADDRVINVVPARDGSVWFATRAGLTRLKDERLRHFSTADGLSTNGVLRLFEDRAGVLWAGSRQGLDRLAGDRFEHVEALPRSLAIPFGQDRDGSLLLGGEQDLEPVARRLDHDRAETIKDLPVVDMIDAGNGQVWFAGTAFGRTVWDSFVHRRASDAPLDYEAYSTADGLLTAQASGVGQHSLALTPDGMLWGATAKGLARFDLRRLPISHTTPVIYLTSVTIGRNTQPASGGLVLPPGTSHVEIDLAAIEISSPEKIRLQYRLDDVDSEWLDAGRDPHAIYSTLPAGTHAFHVRASNRSGIWDRQGVVFSVTQQPFFYQTRAFAVVAALAGLLLVVVVYRLRVRQISRAISARFDERLAERTRVARELHDTFLQTVQGSKMVADHALKDVGDHERMRRAMEQLSAWLGRATEEGRAALQSLRASTFEKNDLAAAFRRAIDECRGSGQADVSFAVQGSSRQMHPVVRDEVYRIGYEAIRNACAHSGGSRVDVELRYGRDLVVRVADNGKGMDAATTEYGKPGHFGLQGMRERAERIGATLSVTSAPAAGTEIVLAVPARTIFT